MLLSNAISKQHSIGNYPFDNAHSVFSGTPLKTESQPKLRPTTHNSKLIDKFSPSVLLVTPSVVVVSTEVTGNAQTRNRLINSRFMQSKYSLTEAEFCYFHRQRAGLAQIFHPISDTQSNSSITLPQIGWNRESARPTKLFIND